MPVLASLLALLGDLFGSRRQLLLENLALRQQTPIAVAYEGELSCSKAPAGSQEA